MSQKLAIRSALALALVLAASGMASAACPTNPFFLDLKSGVNAVNPQITYKSALANSPAASCTGWKEAVLKIDLKGCTQANIVVEYEGTPKDWTVNLGDSPTNDGYAGDAGTTPNNAELWILNEDLSVANGGNAPGVIDNPIARLDMALTDSALKFVVRNQYLSLGNPAGLLQTPNTKKLFAIPDTAVGSEGSNIYLGINRTIANPSRRGCGARRVLITLQ
jgi:hypothetical protein